MGSDVVDRNQAGTPSMGGHAEQQGLGGYADDDTPTRDGHVAEPEVGETFGDDIADAEAGS